jgi:hypothetical protein
MDSNIRTRTTEGSDARRILIGMVVNSRVLNRVASQWNGSTGLFSSKYANTIAQWCIEHHRRYNKCPSGLIRSIFDGWAERQRELGNETTVDMVERLLETMQREHKQLGEVNADYTIDLAGKYFNRVSLERLVDEVQGELSGGEVQKAEAVIAQRRRVELGVGAGIDPLRNLEAIQQAFAERRESLIQYDGELGKFFGDALERDGFVAFMGSAKRGKSFWLLDMAWRAMEQRRRVAFFEVGDMSQNQILRRFMCRAAQRPLKAETVDKPVWLKREPKAIPRIQYKRKTFEHGLRWREAWRACERVVRLTRTNKPLLRLSCHPNLSISINGIEGILAGWEQENSSGWTPDIIVIDYADILAPDHGSKEVRDQINDTWRKMRALSQKLHCLVLTATQADAKSYEAHLMRRQNFSEDRRKHDHVTGMIGISVTDGEKAKGLCRLNWIDLREGEFTESKVLYVAGSFKLANPAMLSCF